MGQRALPTDGELAILSVLWELGPATVRQIHEHLPSTGTGYTTTLKLMQLMAEKGLLRRDESQRSHIYRATRGPTHTQGRLVADLARRAFGGSAAKLAMQALSAQTSSPEEIAQLRGYLDDLERKHRR